MTIVESATPSASRAFATKPWPAARRNVLTMLNGETTICTTTYIAT